MIPPPPRSTLLPYPTLFRSQVRRRERVRRDSPPGGHALIPAIRAGATAPSGQSITAGTTPSTPAEERDGDDKLAFQLGKWLAIASILYSDFSCCIQSFKMSKICITSHYYQLGGKLKFN